MKKLIIILMFGLTVGITYGQTKIEEERINYFVEAAVEEYQLNETQTKTLKEKRTELILTLTSITKQIKEGKKSTEEAKEERKDLNSKFVDFMCLLTGKTKKECIEFVRGVNKKIKELN